MDRGCQGIAEGGHLLRTSTEFGAKVGALIGLGVDGAKGFIAAAELGALAGEDGIQLLSEDTALDILENIPNDSE